MELRLTAPCLVVLAGPSGAGKSTWANENFAPGQVVWSDALRAMVGLGEHDRRAGTDAFDVLDLVVEKRLARRLTTVIDTLGFDGERRARYRDLARRHGMACYLVAFDTPAAECRVRNRRGPAPVPSRVLTAQLRRWSEVLPALGADGYDAVVSPAPLRLVPPEMSNAPELAVRQKEDPVSMQFGLQIPGSIG